MKYKLLFIGVPNGAESGNSGLPALRPLGTPVKDAEGLKSIFLDVGLNQQGDNTALTAGAAGRDAILQALGGLNGADSLDLALIYWSGHMVKTEENHCFLLTADTRSIPELERTMVPLDSLLRAISLVKCRSKILILDVCFAGEAIESYVNLREARQRMPDIPVLGQNENFYILVSSYPGQSSYTAAVYSEFTGNIIGALQRQVEEHSAASTEMDLVAALDHACTRQTESMTNQRSRFLFEGSRHQIKIPIVRQRRRVNEDRQEDSMEQALGYAMQAFRQHLERDVVSGVEVLYFLSYDPWDGCLIYDGLVRGSLEQKLINYIRNCFLRKDRLRSKYEENRVTGEPLGVAGQCFQAAIDAVNAGDKLPAMRYIANLAKETSEYGAFDMLLGLSSCLYIPVILDGSLEANGKSTPLGGILMAGNRKPFGLKPKEGTDSLKRHEEIQRRLSEYERCCARPADPAPDELRTAVDAYRHAADGKPKEEEVRAFFEQESRKVSDALRQDINSHRDVSGSTASEALQSFLRCIGSVYEQRAKRRKGLRQTLHPSFVKTIARQFKDPQGNVAKIQEIVEGFVQKAEGLRQGRGAVEFASTMKRNSGMLANGTGNLDLALARDYGFALAWRDLQIYLRTEKADEAGRREASAELQEIVAAQENGVLQDWDEYIRFRSLFGGHNPQTDAKRGMTPEALATFIDGLIDDLRESPLDLFEIFRRSVHPFAPVSRYMGGINKILFLLSDDERQRYINDIAHMVQLLLLGLWLGEAPVQGWHPSTVDETAAGNGSFSFKHCLADAIALYFFSHKNADAQIIEGNAGKLYKETAAMLPIYWGLIAGLHDIADPIQRFEQWCRDFYQGFLGEEVINVSGWNASGLVDIFRHPRFPVYKTAISNLHQDPQRRNWIDTVFTQQLTRNIDHAFAGALILFDEIAPDGGYSDRTAKWTELPRYLERIRKDKHERPERALFLPAYLAHAIALSHLHGLHKQWIQEEQELPDAAAGARPALGKKAKRIAYFLRTAKSFRLRMDQFPLTYLLALFEVILVQEIDLGEHDDNAGRRKYDGREVIFVDFERKTVEDKSPSSPFYIESLDVTSTPFVIRFGLRIWRDNYKAERRKWGAELDRIRTLWRSRAGGIGFTRHEWKVWDDDAFDDKFRNSLGYEIDPGDNDSRNFARGLFDILQLVLRLEQFQTHYDCGRWKIEFEFKNIEGKSRVFALGEDHPDRGTKRSAPDNWDNSYHRAGTQRLWPTDYTVSEEFIERLKLHPPAKVLDIGCGDGKNTILLASHDFKVVGIDSSQTALDECTRYAESANLVHQIELKPAMDFLTYQSPERYQAAICIDVLGHLLEPEKMLSKIAEVVAQGGLLYASVFALEDDVFRTQTRLLPAKTRGESYHYYPEKLGSLHRYYFRFYNQREAEEIFSANEWEIVTTESRKWRERPHPGYRSEWHTHCSWFITAKRK